MRKSVSLKAVLARLCMGIMCTVLFVFCVGTAHAAAPSPDEDGQYFCKIHDNSGDDSVVIGPNKCCYEEIVNGDDLLTVCIQCDSDWKNCKEVWEDGSSRPRISLPPAGGGTLSDPRPRKNSAPALKLK